MESISYKPFGVLRIVGWVWIGLGLMLGIVSYYFILPALVPLIFGFLFLRKSRLTVILDDSGVRLLHEKTNPDRFIPWEDLPCYRLDNTSRGQDVVLLSPKPIPSEVARRFSWIPRISNKLWFDGVLVLPLCGLGNTENVRKFAYQKCSCK